MKNRYLEIASTPAVTAGAGTLRQRGPMDARGLAPCPRRTARRRPARCRRTGVHRQARRFLSGQRIGDRLALCPVSRRAGRFPQDRRRRTLGYADFRGNRQYITTGNVETNDRVSLFMMDYAHQRRLKIFGRMRVVDARDDAALTARLAVEGYRAHVERAVLIAVEAFDWNCPQHITPRFHRRRARIRARTAARGDGASAPGKRAPPLPGRRGERRRTGPDEASIHRHKDRTATMTSPSARSSVLATGGGAALMNPSDTLVLLLDHQSGRFQTVKDIPVADLRRNVEMIARLCTLLNIPVITTASEPSGSNGPLMPEIHHFAPHAVYVPRKGRGECLGQ